MQPYFESVPLDEACTYCTGRSATTPLPKPIEAIYCISLQEQPERTRQAVAHFHRIGLCRHVTLYRPVRGKHSERAVWESHRTLARHAVANGRHCALMLEDDVTFRQPWSKLAPRIARAIAALPPDWQCFYLGHLPLQAYFVRPNILRVRSSCAHAYVANSRFLTWLTDTEPYNPEVPAWQLIGSSVDGAMANLPGMYALFPMAARQRFLGDYRINAQVDDTGRTRPWHDTVRWRYYFILHGARLFEGMAVVLSPFHRFTLERFRERNSVWFTDRARLISTSGLFDGGYYLRQSPDLVAREANPLWHYLYDGAVEGRVPSPLFDPRYYAAQSPDLGGENPLVHYICTGTALGRNPHPLFDTAYYLSRHAAEIPPGMHPLAHFLIAGGMAGFDPHPLFDSAWYLSQHPELRERGENPLVHYLTAGWRHGAAPHPQFDGELYLQWNPDVKAAGVNPLDHFARHGQAEGRAQPVPEMPAQVTA